MHARAEPVALYEPHTDLHMHKDSGLYMDSDSHISASAYPNMGLFFSPGSFHYLFLTALVHPLSTCAYLLFLSHCNNYILPSYSRQPKLASCILYLPVGAFFLFHQSSPNLLTSLMLPVGAFFPLRHFSPNLLASRWLPVGVFFLFHHFSPNLLASRWLPVGAFFLFHQSSPNLLASKLAAMHVLGLLLRIILQAFACT